MVGPNTLKPLNLCVWAFSVFKIILTWRAALKICYRRAGMEILYFSLFIYKCNISHRFFYFWLFYVSRFSNVVSFIWFFTSLPLSVCLVDHAKARNWLPPRRRGGDGGSLLWTGEPFRCCNPKVCVADRTDITPSRFGMRWRADAWGTMIERRMTWYNLPHKYTNK